MRNHVRFLTVCALIPYATAARAEEPPNLPQCAEAFEKAQLLNKQGKLNPALEQLLVCAQASCPAFLARECTANYDRIKVSVPTVTLIARRSEAEPLVDVSVRVGGKTLVTRIDGLSVPMDPGLHEFVFEMQGEAPVTVKVLLAEGEKNKPVIAEFRAPPPVAPAPVAPAAPPKATQPSPQQHTQSLHVPTAAYVLGGVGIVGLGVGVAFRALGASDYNSLAETCGHRCNQVDVDAAKRKYLISHIGFGLGAAAVVATGVTIYLAQPRELEAERSAVSVEVIPTLGRDAAGAIVSGRF